MLTTTGRISIAKALLLSQYIYCFSCIDVSADMTKRIQEQLDNFIYGETKMKMAWTRLFIHRERAELASSNYNLS
jgi:hypothetical protein